MALNATEVAVAITGQVYSAPIGTTPPDDSTTALDAAFIGHGYVDEDGVTEDWDDSVDNIVAWQNATTIRSSTTESTGTLQFKLLQLNKDNLELYYRGSEMVIEGAGPDHRLDVKPVVADPRMFVLDVIDGSKHYRTLCGNAEVTERGEVMNKNGDPIGLELTVTVYPDADGNLMQKWSDDPAWNV